MPGEVEHVVAVGSAAVEEEHRDTRLPERPPGGEDRRAGVWVGDHAVDLSTE
jgi:hypothetical protein